MSLARWEPIRDMASLRNMMDRLYEEGLWGPQILEGENIPPLDVLDRDDEYQVVANLPGIKPEDLDITLSDHTLCIRGDYEEEHEEKEYLLHERRYGSFTRSVTLPASLDAEHAEARFENGVLTLTVPKAAEAKPKRIQVRPTGALQEGGQESKAA